MNIKPHQHRAHAPHHEAGHEALHARAPAEGRGFVHGLRGSIGRHWFIDYWLRFSGAWPEVGLYLSDGPVFCVRLFAAQHRLQLVHLRVLRRVRVQVCVRLVGPGDRCERTDNDASRGCCLQVSYLQASTWWVSPGSGALWPASTSINLQGK